MKMQWTGLCLLAIATMCASKNPVSSDTAFLTPGTFINVTENIYGSNTLRTYCYPGKRYSVLNLFETVEFVLAIDNEDYAQYGGKTPDEVQEHYNEQRSLFSITLFSQKRQRIQLSPFDQQCIGISSRQPYSVILNTIQLDLWRFVQFSLGFLTFWSARRLAKNSVFYYLAGVIIGICASLLVVIYLAAKLFPRRPMMYGVLIGGWTIGFYVLKQLADNLRLILLTYRDHVVWYLVVTGLISFLICYRIGPPKNPRSQNIIMWVLQAMGGVLVYFSSWHTSALIFLMVVAFLAHYFPRSWMHYAKMMYRRRFPTKRRLLTQEEYQEQTAIETSKSLSELRKFVNSPECRQWSVMSNLRNPMRFASFANGAPHLDDEEIEDYSRAIEESLEASPQEDPEEFLQCSMYYRPSASRRLLNRSRHRVNIPLPNSQHRNRVAARNLENEESEDEFLEQEADQPLQ
ncbi:nuclear envelope integral membrane protein 1 [Drosophila eugracilis]|uniref:nuclear envelope integral membrane protein 1 n=1 Tax=Drosophila eugracilis TaxID=29029 RepID=UPI0007E7834B|nr:nuclear envelope integral membrane protein 1 [Drosophila eugracilis]